MANTFDEQAKERFRRSLAFMQKAHALLQDDLVYRSALADAVSAIKNMLQGYLLLRVSTMPASAVTQRWQEVAVTNRMPDLIQACIEAGLSLHGLERDIKRLNNERNYRTHDDPQRLVNPEQAAEAYELALTVQKRIKAAVQGKTGAESVGTSPAPARSGNSGRLAPVRAAMSGTLSTIRAAASATARPSTATAPAAPPLPAPVHEPPVRQPAPAEAGAGAPVAPSGDARTGASEPQPAAQAASSKEHLPVGGASEGSATSGPAADAGDAADVDDEAAPDETYISLPVVTSRRRRRGVVMLVRGLVAAALLVVGVVAGAGLMIPVARGQAPNWLGFASRLVATPTASVTATPTATPGTSAGLQTVGNLTVIPSACSAGTMTVILSNLGQSALAYAVSTSGRATLTTGTGSSATPKPALFDTLAPSGSVTVTLAGVKAGDQVVVVGPDGAVVAAVMAC